MLRPTWEDVYSWEYHFCRHLHSVNRTPPPPNRQIISILRQATNMYNNNNYFWGINPIYYAGLCGIERKGWWGDCDVVAACQIVPLFGVRNPRCHTSASWPHGRLVHMGSGRTVRVYSCLHQSHWFGYQENSISIQDNKCTSRVFKLVTKI